MHFIIPLQRFENEQEREQINKMCLMHIALHDHAKFFFSLLFIAICQVIIFQCSMLMVENNNDMIVENLY